MTIRKHSSYAEAYLRIMDDINNSTYVEPDLICCPSVPITIYGPKKERHIWSSLYHYVFCDIRDEIFSVITGKPIELL